jgi:ABC-2 type transport system ATP-binding protein
LSAPIIDISHLTHRYKGADYNALDDLSMQIQEGEIVGLVGPNGAGKTSFISILAGILLPSSGSVQIANINILKEKEKIKQFIGFVPQEYALYPQLSARQNLYFFGSMYKINKHELTKRIDEGLEAIKLTPFADKKIATFSGGMKRRINLLVGLLHKPKILLLDEPTVGVDVHSKLAIMDLLKQQQKMGTTLIYSSHILHEIQEFCTHIALINNGKIKLFCRTTELHKMGSTSGNLEDIFLQNIQ